MLYVHIQKGYFNVYSFYIGQILTELPFSAVDVLIFSTVAYWMIGLYASFDCFILFYLFAYLARMTC